MEQNENETPFKALEKQLAALEAEEAELTASIPLLEKQLEHKQQRLYELTGIGGYGSKCGLTQKVRDKVERARLLEADNLLRPVRMLVIDSPGSREIVCVVRKATPKLIYLSEPGNKHTWTFRKDGKEALKQPAFEIHPDDLKWILA